MSDEALHTQTPAPRELLLMRSGGRHFAVYADEAEGVTEWREPVPLPHAPPAVLGVVCVRGRMRTVLDPAALPGAPPESGGTADPAAPLLVVSLRGDEQLALAVTSAERADARDARHAPPDPPAPFLRATFTHAGRAVHLLDPARLFDAALSGADRRRPRLK